MDLSSMLNSSNNHNSGPSPAAEPEKRAWAPPAPPPTTPGANGPPAAAPAGYPPGPQQTPLYGGGAPPATAPPSGQHSGVTPLHTPTQTPAAAAGSGGGAQYPFPPQPLPGGPAAAPYPAFGPPHAAPITPGARPPSHGYPFAPQPSPQQPWPPHHPVHGPSPAQLSASLSPTLSSHPSAHTPHSVRQSPVSAMQQQYQRPQQHQHQQPPPPPPPPQPSTRLGPPLHPYQRPSNHSSQELQSPYHPHTWSGASNGIVAGSPGQHQANIGGGGGGGGSSTSSGFADSPGAYDRASPDVRRTSDYHAPGERERSVSVSPKTRVPPRSTSLGSRHSSQENTPSARSSLHNSQKIDLSRLLSPMHSSPAVDGADGANGGAPTATATTATSPAAALAPPRPEPTTSAKPSPQPSQPAVSPPLAARAAAQLDPQDESGAADALAVQMHGPSSTQPSPLPGAGVPTDPPPMPTAGPAKRSADPPEASRKRPAEFEPAMTDGPPPAKRGKRRKYQQRPIWARLAKSNPHFHDRVNGTLSQPPPPRPAAAPNGLSARSSPPSQHAPPPPHHEAPPPQYGPPSSHHVSPPPHHVPPPQANGHPPIDMRLAEHPWRQDPPLDWDLVKARLVFGRWEKSFNWNTKHPDIETAVADWLFENLWPLEHVGTDPAEGAIEIEAKIGWLRHKSTDDRILLPSNSITVLKEEWVRNMARFESQMDQRTFEAANELMNNAVRASREPGRVPIGCEHPRETDSFRTLSAAGYQALPPAFREHRAPSGRDLKLRTSTNAKGEVTARIVKINLAHLHILNPRGDYDARISINLEANLNRPDLAPYTDLVEEPTSDRPAPPDRKKDRCSYKHLAYSIDLTRVDVAGIAPKYELELEVDAGVLREQQMVMGAGGPPDSYLAVVSGFLENATSLMRLKPKPT